MNWLFNRFDKYGLIIVVVIPTVLTLLYSLFVAQERYTVESQVIVRESDSGGMPLLSGMALGLFGANSASLEDAYILRGYLYSGSFLNQLNGEFDLREHYGNVGFDFMHGLSQSASQEDFLEYFRNALRIEIDPEASIITIATTAFSPEMALEMNKFMVASSEDEINRLNRIIAESQTRFAQKELDTAEAFLIKAESKLLAFQHEHGIADANSEAVSLFTRISELEGVLTTKETELKGMLKYIREDAIPVRALQQEIEAVKQQLEEEDAELSGSAEGGMLPIIQTFQHLRMEVNFAAKAYASSFAALESAKLEITRQEKFLLLVAPPQIPDAPSAPEPIWETLTVLVVSLLLLGIIKLIIATIRDHTI
ncbi:hypothetical protein [Rubellicoccus peritrichatus]|uniref:Capsular polysaccharide transport system permease protein n=1 Tax=Rubellicoccus peritrichatus TaxID=3080537 RepID=A0AAQ3LB09_9BACT|nr:hypothetical protein [Puniceicoccus sp. CR14]WOO40957.1 hypothetical protein RZN69_20240 [Puniceicoccus sp. CR14]